MSVRLPSAASYVAAVEKEQRWLPVLAPLLPLAIPVPLGIGGPGHGYPWPWSVYRWLEGEPATREGDSDLSGLASDLATFLIALQRIDAREGPPAGAHNFFRGAPLDVYDAQTRRAVADLGDAIEGGAALAAWDAALGAHWRGPPVWVHGDIAPGNLLLREGRLAAVIDFGTSAVGDPACDLVIAWTFLSGQSRETFRALMPADSRMWARARGWALWKAVIVLAGHAKTNAPEARNSRYVLNEVLADHQGFG